MADALPLSPGQYGLVVSLYAFAIAAMLSAFVFFVVAQRRVAPPYRISLMVSALVVGIAGYHYLRIAGAWDAAYVFAGGLYVPSGTPFNDAYRYVDWLLTVPLLLTELVLVLNLPRKKSSALVVKLGLAAAAMIALGYPGEVAPAEATGARALWGLLSALPFAYILFVLWGELGRSMDAQPEGVRVLFRNTRLLLVATWGFYPIAYMAPIFGISGAGAVTAIQAGYALADVAAKAGYGLLIYAIAREKTSADGWTADAALAENRLAAA